jgi:hypothetical protein
MSAPGVCYFASLTPNRGVGGAPRNVRVQRHPLGMPSVRHKTRVNALMTRHARRLARRLASHDAGRSPLGAPPWRFWASGPRFRLLRRPPSLQRRAVALRIRAASSSQPGRSAWRAGSRASRGQRLQAACRRTPRLAPPSGCLRRRPSMSKAANLLAQTRFVVSRRSCDVVKKFPPQNYRRCCRAHSNASGKLGLLPPPLWGRVGEGGDAVR